MAGLDGSGKSGTHRNFFLFVFACTLYFFCTELFVFNVLHFAFCLLLKHNTNIHVPDGIRIHNPSKRAATNPRLRPLSHWDQQIRSRAVQAVASSYID